MYPMYVVYTHIDNNVFSNKYKPRKEKEQRNCSKYFSSPQQYIQKDLKKKKEKSPIDYPFNFFFLFSFFFSLSFFSFPSAAEDQRKKKKKKERETTGRDATRRAVTKEK